MTRALTLLTLLAGTAAAPALAQDCGGVGTGGIWIGGDAASSDVAAAAGPMNQLALVLAGNSYVSLFSLSAAADVRLEARGNGAGDPTLELYDDAGQSVAFDDDSGGETAARIETSLDAGTYCLAMSSFGGVPMTGTVRVGLATHEALTTGPGGAEPDGADLLPPDLAESGETGTSMGCGDGATIADGTIDDILPGAATVTAPIDEVSGYGFSLSAPATISITAENEDADPVLTLKDASGAVLYENDDYDSLNSRIDVSTPLEPGDYCIELRALSDASLPVTVTVMGYDPEAAQTSLYDRGERVPPLDGSYPVEMLGEVTGRLRADIRHEPNTVAWFAVDVTEAGLLLVEAIAPGDGDPVLYLYDDLGREVGYNDDAGSGLDSLIAARVLPGTYLLAVKDLGGEPSMMRLSVERFVPAD